MGSVDRQDKPSPASPDPLLGFLATESSSDPVAALVPGLPQVAWWGERALTGLGDWSWPKPPTHNPAFAAPHTALSYS